MFEDQVKNWLDSKSKKLTNRIYHEMLKGKLRRLASRKDTTGKHENVEHGGSRKQTKTLDFV